MALTFVYYIEVTSTLSSQLPILGGMEEHLKVVQRAVAAVIAAHCRGVSSYVELERLSQAEVQLVRQRGCAPGLCRPAGCRCTRCATGERQCQTSCIALDVDLTRRNST